MRGRWGTTKSAGNIGERPLIYARGLFTPPILNHCFGAVFLLVGLDILCEVPAYHPG